MKKSVMLLSFAAAILAGGAFAKEVRDWEDLHQVHVKLQEAIKDMERAQRANHYDMGGHAAKAEQLMRQAERELNESVETVKRERR